MGVVPCLSLFLQNGIKDHIPYYWMCAPVSVHSSTSITRPDLHAWCHAPPPAGGNWYNWYNWYNRRSDHRSDYRDFRSDHYVARHDDHGPNVTSSGTWYCQSHFHP